MNGRQEVAVGLGAYAAYLAVRGVVWTERGRAKAHRNAERLIALERRVGVLIEPRIQALALRAPVSSTRSTPGTPPGTSP